MFLIAFGTRPEWIKIKPLVDKMDGVLPYTLLFTGQHSTLVDLDGVKNLKTIEIEDICDLRLDSIVSSVLQKLYNLHDIKYVIVQGDTTSAFAVALAAFHREIPVIHLEAGLRTYDNKNPYPEEFNRKAISAIASIHFAPTKHAYDNLIREGYENAYIVGNTSIDNIAGIIPAISNDIVCTLHRRENLNIIGEWFDVVNKIAAIYGNYRFVIPMHPNPRIVSRKDKLSNLVILDPLSHTDFTILLKNCRMVITDSGGVQEEAAFFKKKTIVCRKTTERPEGLNKFSWLCKSPDKLQLLFSLYEKADFPEGECPYGDGNSSERIVRILEKL